MEKSLSCSAASSAASPREKMETSVAGPADPIALNQTPGQNNFGDRGSTHADVDGDWNTPFDVMESPNSSVLKIDMPGLKHRDIKVEVEEDSVLVIRGERKREEPEEGESHYGRWMGKFMKKFFLPVNANTEAISARFWNGVVIVTVYKLPQPEPKKKKIIEVKLTREEGRRARRRARRG